MEPEAIESLEEQLRVAMLNSDIAQLDALLSPALVFTTFLGEKIGKSHDLEAHRSGYLKMHALKLSDLEVLSLGDVFVVTCGAEIDATFDDDRTKNPFRFTRIWSKNQEGHYQVIVAQATLVFSSI